MKHRSDYDLMRLIAIVLVVFNHSEFRGFTLYQLPGSFVNQTLSLILAILCKIAVPLFFMISGGLLLHRQESIGQVLRKRVLRMVVVALLFSALYYGFVALRGEVPEASLSDFLNRLWHSGVNTPYWYLYAYTGLMLMLPLLQPLAQSLPDRGFLYLTGLHCLIYGVLRPIGLISGLGEFHQDFLLPVAERTIYYFLMGYYFAHRMDWNLVTKRTMLWAGFLSVGAVTATFLLVRFLVLPRGADPELYLQAYLCLPVFTVYGCVHKLLECRPVSATGELILGQFGGLVFGTYLLESFGRWLLIPLYDLLEVHIHVLPACLAWVICTVVCCMALTWVLKRIPVLNRLL